MIGKEIVRSLRVFAVFLLAADLPLPKSIVAHGWLLFEESKMSKSRGNIVRSETILERAWRRYAALFPDARNRLRERRLIQLEPWWDASTPDLAKGWEIFPARAR